MQHRFGLLILILTAALAAPAVGQTAPPTKTRPHIMAADSTTRVIYLVRHAEKCERQGSNPGLTKAGQERAELLKRMLTDAPITALYTTPYNRTRQTAAPVAEAHRVDPTEVSPRSQYSGDLRKRLLAADDAASLVVGHSNTIPPLVNSLAGTDLPSYSEAVYDRFYIVTLPEDGPPHAIVLRYGPEDAGDPGC